MTVTSDKIYQSLLISSDFITRKNVRFWSTVVTIRTTRFNITILRSIHTVYFFCVDLGTNSDYFRIQHWLVFVTETECLLRGTDRNLTLYSPVVTICTASLIFNNSTFCPHTVFMCFVWIWEQIAIISLYNINWLVCITEMGSVYCAVRTGYLNTWCQLQENCKRVKVASHLRSTAVQDVTTSRITQFTTHAHPSYQSSSIQSSLHIISFLTHCHSKLHTFRYVRHVKASMTKHFTCPHVGSSDSLSVRMQKGQELKCQGHSIPSYFALRWVMPHTARTAIQCDCSYAQDLITAQQLLLVYHGFWQRNRAWIPAHSQITHFA
jgi:hypothetical protein